MITVSDKAAAVLHDALDMEDAGTRELFRLTGKADDLTLLISAERRDDEVVSHDRRRVLAVPRELSGALDGAVLDALDTADGPRLILRVDGDE